MLNQGAEAFVDYVPYWSGLHTECGFLWDENDVLRFLDKLAFQPHPTDPNKTCVIFTGARSRGRGNTAWYGSFWTKGKTVRAHKFSGVAILGLRPHKGLDHLDHTCRNSRCVCCLEVVPVMVNLKRRWGHDA